MTLTAEPLIDRVDARDVDADTIGKRLTELRTARGVTQLDLARRLREICERDQLDHRVTQSSVARWEAGTEIPASMILPLCSLLRCSPNVFFTHPAADVAPPQRGRPKKNRDN